MGPGPDGGRDGVFDGPVPLSSHGADWSGYGVIQVKHKARASTPSADATWLIDQIRDELDQWASGVRRSRVPQLYLLVTNVRLSATAVSGGRDRVEAALEQFRGVLGMRGFLVWDGESIEALLDAHPQVRQTYTAWVTSGDVLAAVLQQLRTPEDRFTEAMPRTVAKEMLARRAARLDEAGDGGDHALPLSSVFVDIPAEAHTLITEVHRFGEGGNIVLVDDGLEPSRARQPELPGVAEVDGDSAAELAPGEQALGLLLDIAPASPLKPKAIAAGQREVAGDYPSDATPNRNPLYPCGAVETPALGILLAAGNLPLSDTTGVGLANPAQWVLVAGPGQGKSTIGQFLCQIYRAHLLNDHPLTRLMPEVGSAVQALLETARAEDLPPVRATRWPLHIPLAAFAEALIDGTAADLLGFAAARLTGYLGSAAITSADLHAWLKAMPWCVVLDGLDEVPASPVREKIVEAITDFRVDIAAADADVLLVATTRPQGYQKEFSPEHFHHLHLQQLPAATAARYAQRLITARYSTDPATADNLLRRVQAAADETSSATTWLMRTPLQVTIMTMLLAQIGEAPTDRAGLFTEYYNTIYRRELGKNLATSRLLRDHRHVIDTLHNRIGLLLHVTGAAGIGTGSQIAAHTLTQLLHAILAEEGFEPDAAAQLAAQLRDTTTERLVFLVGATADHVAFEVRTLQEFCAARALLDGPEQLLLPRLAGIAGGAHWRNTLSLACGLVFTNRHSMRDLVVTFCHDLDSTDSPAPLLDTTGTERPHVDDIRASVMGGKVLHAGAELAATLLTDGVAYSQPRYRGLLLSVAAGLLDRTDAVAIRILTDLSARADLRGAIDAAIADQLRTGDPARHILALHLLCLRTTARHTDERAATLLRTHLDTAPAVALRSYVLHALAAGLLPLVGHLATAMLRIPVPELIRAATGYTYSHASSCPTAILPWGSGVTALVLNTLARALPAEHRQESLFPEFTVTDWVPATQSWPNSGLERLSTAAQWRWLRAMVDYTRKPNWIYLRAAVDAIHAAEWNELTLAYVLSLLPWPITAAHAHDTDPDTYPFDPTAVSARALTTIEQRWRGGVDAASILQPTSERFFPLAATRLPPEIDAPVSTVEPQPHSHDHIPAILDAAHALDSAPATVHRSRRALWLLQQLPACTPPHLLTGHHARDALQILIRHASRTGRCAIDWSVALHTDPAWAAELEELGRSPVVFTVTRAVAACCPPPLRRAVSTVASASLRSPDTHWGRGRLAEALHDAIAEQPITGLPTPADSDGEHAGLIHSLTVRGNLAVALAVQPWPHEPQTPSRHTSIARMLDRPALAVPLAYHHDLHISAAARTVLHSVQQAFTDSSAFLDATVLEELKLPPLHTYNINP